MELSIQEILRDHKVNSVIHTHVSMGHTRGKYLFNRQDLEELWKVYGKTITESPETNIGIAEKPQHYLPVLGDVDIKIRETEDVQFDDVIHTERHVKEVVEVFQSVLRKIVDECSDRHLTCVLLEKPLYRITKNGIAYAKHGFHVHFPYCFLNKIDQEIHLIPRVQAMLSELKTFEDIGIEDSGDVIDKACCKVPWLLYGSRKESGMDPYLVSKIFDANGQETTLEDAFKHYQLFDMRENLIPIKGKINEYLPRILSIIPYGRQTSEVKNGLASPLKEKMREQKSNNKEYKKQSVVKELEIAKQLLPMLSDFRTSDRNEWMNVGWCLYNISEGSPEGLELWCNFSSRCEQEYDEAVCVHHWERMVKRELTLGTLRYYAEVDSPERYREFKKEQAVKYVQESLNGSHNDIAKVLHSLYGNQFVCASIASKTWFEYQKNNHKWEQIEEGVFLREKISGEIVDMYTEEGHKVLTALAGVSDKGEEAMFNARLKQTQKMISNLKSAPFKNNVMKEAMEVFYDKRFREKLDTNPALFPCKNGVYELATNIFRPGRPEDFISKTSNITWKEYNEDDDAVHNVHEYLEKVFPDTSVRKYFMDIASDIFMGGNHQKHVYFWTGEGDNAKSVTQNIFEKMLGPLSIKFNTTVITGKKVQSGAANPELARAGGGVRMATLEEPNSDEMINIGILKNLSGNDSYYARDLFEKGKEGREIVPMFKLMFICLSEGTRVSLSNGTSVSIEKLTENHRLLSWDSKSNGLIKTQQQKFIDKGEQDCLTITLIDGRTINCTPNHKFLTSNEEWIDAKDITVDTVLNMGIDNPTVDDMYDSIDYIFKVGDLQYDLKNHDDKMKASALCRLIGYVITDGSQNKTLYMGHKIDCDNVLEDIYLLTGKTPSIVESGTTFAISIPNKISKEICKLLPNKNGRKVNHEMILPSFLFDNNCPTFLIRELLGGIFGGDGVLPSVGKNQCKEDTNSLLYMFTKLSEVLLNRFDICSTVSKPKYYENYHTDLSSKDKYNVFLRISKNESILKFIENIGVRYCCHKSYRLVAVASIIRYKNIIINQNQKIIDRTRELIDKYKKQNVKQLIVQYTKNHEYMNTFKTTQEAQNHTGLNHSSIRGAIKRGGLCGGFIWEEDEQVSEILDEEGCKTIKEAYEMAKEEIREKIGISNEESIVTYDQIRSYLVYKNDYKLPWVNVDKYLKDTKLINFCNKQSGDYKHNYSVGIDETALPCYQMSVINIKKGGKRHVYDLNVEEPYSNFIAEGVVTHNCNKLPKLKYSDKAVWNRIRVIPFESTFCRPDDPAPTDYDEQLRQKRFPMDKDFGRKIPDMIDAFAWILIKHRLNIRERIEPEKVRIATAIYRKENDIYRQFVEECITEDKDKTLSLTELYAQFKEWFKDSLPNHTLPIKNEVEEYFSRLWDDPDRGKKWKGYRIRTLQDDIADGDAIVLDDDDLVDYDEDGKNLPPM